MTAALLSILLLSVGILLALLAAEPEREAPNQPEPAARGRHRRTVQIGLS